MSLHEDKLIMECLFCPGIILAPSEWQMLRGTIRHLTNKHKTLSENLYVKSYEMEAEKRATKKAGINTASRGNQEARERFLLRKLNQLHGKRQPFRCPVKGCSRCYSHRQELRNHVIVVHLGRAKKEKDEKAKDEKAEDEKAEKDGKAKKEYHRLMPPLPLKYMNRHFFFEDSDIACQKIQYLLDHPEILNPELAFKEIEGLTKNEWYLLAATATQFQLMEIVKHQSSLSGLTAKYGLKRLHDWIHNGAYTGEGERPFTEPLRSQFKEILEDQSLSDESKAERILESLNARIKSSTPAKKGKSGTSAKKGKKPSTEVLQFHSDGPRDVWATEVEGHRYQILHYMRSDPVGYIATVDGVIQDSLMNSQSKTDIGANSANSVAALEEVDSYELSETVPDASMTGTDYVSCDLLECDQMQSTDQHLLHLDDHTLTFLSTVYCEFSISNVCPPKSLMEDGDLHEPLEKASEVDDYLALLDEFLDLSLTNGTVTG